MTPDIARQRPILVVEDDDDLRETLGMVLHDYGYQVITAPSLEEALSLVDQQAFGFILSDLMVRGAGDQLQAVERLRERAFPTPLGIMTGWKLPQAAIDGRGFAWLMSKPFDVDRLMTEIAAGLETPLTVAQERRATVVRAYFAALTSRDWNKLVALCSADVAYVLPPPAPFAAEIHGREAFRRYSQETYRHFPGARFDQVQVYALPQGLVARYVGRWPAADGATNQQSGAVVFRLEGELIKQIGVRLNAEQLHVLTGEGGEHSPQAP